MAGFADLIRDLLRDVAMPLTEDLRPSITIKRWIGTDEFGDAKYHATQLSIGALVEKRNEAIKGPNGQDTVSKTYIAILEPIDPIPSDEMLSSTFKRTGPIDENDVIILPDGTSGPILNVSGFVNKDTNNPYFFEVYLG